ncbi:interferon alpha/beta receptor 2 isoform 3-T6 [Sylvia borin]
MDVPMPLSQLVYLTLLSTAVCSLPGRIVPGLPYNLQMDSQNFQHVLSWQADHDPAVPASYNVLYTDRRRQIWLSAQQCSGTAQLSCELTEEFKDSSTVYALLVQSMGGAQLLNSSVLYFEPFSQTYLGPPEVNITSCPNCINVTIKLPTSHFRKKGKLQSLIDIYEELNYDITLKSQDGEHKACIKKLVYSPWESESEEVASVEIIPTEVKSKARGCRGSASDASDSSDSDSSDVCDHEYTRRGGVGRSSVPQGWASRSSLGQYSVKSSCEHSSSQPGDSPAAEPQQLQGRPEGQGDSSSEVLSPFCEGSCDSQGSRECFTINLRTVLLGTLEEDGHGAAAAPPAQEDAGDWHCAHGLEAKLLEDTASVQEAPCSNDFHEWQNSSSSSEESDPSDSDTELVTGYMRR